MKIVIFTLAAVLAMSSAETQPEPTDGAGTGSAAIRHIPSPDPEYRPMPGVEMPNALSVGGPNCTSIRRQIEAEKSRLRDDDARRLDREPRAFAFHAVDRQVGGCREVTFLGRSRD